jgi:hypothetical protein
MNGGVGSTSIPGATECGCLHCQGERRNRLSSEDMWKALPGMDAHFRFACEICGNKRCPHHTNHRLACTNSNDVGQTGSAYE